MVGFPASSSSSPSPVSFSTAGHRQKLEPFASCDVLDGWPAGGEDWMDGLSLPDGLTFGDEGSGSGSSSRSTGNDDLLSGLPPAPAPDGLNRQRGRKRGVAPTTVCHVEAERQRRVKLNRRLCDLRAAVPIVSRMDKASVLSDATAYIAELRERVKQLEAEAAGAKKAAAATTTAVAPPGPHSLFSSGLAAGDQEEEELVVQMLVGGAAAALRLTTTAARHAPARLMDALRSLDLPVQHASVCAVGGMTVQDVVVDVPAALRDERALRDALLHRLQRSG